MPKPITSDMLHAMTLAERKSLHQNALGRDTPAAHAVLDLLSRDNLMSRPEPAKPAARRTAAPRKSAGTATRKPVKAVHGRRA